MSITIAGLLALIGAAAFLLGFVVASVVSYRFGTKPLIDDIRQMRYYGFRPDGKIEVPKTLPIPFVNED